MGLDATLFRINFKVNSDLEYEKIRYKKWQELNKDIQKFDEWENKVWEEILYTSNWDIANIINSRNTGEKAVDFKNNRDLVLSRRDIEIIINKMKNKNDNYYNKYIKQLENCLKTTDFNKQTLLYGEWF